MEREWSLAKSAWPSYLARASIVGAGAPPSAARTRLGVLRRRIEDDATLLVVAVSEKDHRAMIMRLASGHEVRRLVAIERRVRQAVRYRSAQLAASGGAKVVN